MINFKEQWLQRLPYHLYALKIYHHSCHIYLLSFFCCFFDKLCDWGRVMHKKRQKKKVQQVVPQIIYVLLQMLGLIFINRPLVEIDKNSIILPLLLPQRRRVAAVKLQWISNQCTNQTKPNQTIEIKWTEWTTHECYSITPQVLKFLRQINIRVKALCTAPWLLTCWLANASFAYIAS